MVIVSFKVLSNAGYVFFDIWCSFNISHSSNTCFAHVFGLEIKD